MIWIQFRKLKYQITAVFRIGEMVKFNNSLPTWFFSSLCYVVALVWNMGKFSFQSFMLFGICRKYYKSRILKYFLVNSFVEMKEIRYRLLYLYSLWIEKFLLWYCMKNYCNRWNILPFSLFFFWWRIWFLANETALDLN